MEPEVARRCKSCGAAFRARAAFCPQCGVSLIEEEAGPLPKNAQPAAAPENLPLRATDSRPNVETIAPQPKAEASVRAEPAAETQAPAPVDARSLEPASPQPPMETPTRADAASAAAPVVASAPALPGKRQRVSRASRAIEDDGALRRSEKLRRASNVMLDEAAADPSLRFVLVATVLIILSLLLLLLGRVL